MNNTFDESINYLKSSPVFAMSLGSKELFHSNFWAWIIEQEYGKEFIHVFFPNFVLEQFDKCEREDKNRDLVIYDKNGKQYIIENKIKSYPNKKQLEDYEKETGESFAFGVITGLIEPPFIPGEKWRFVSYSNIANKIQAIISRAESQYDKDLLTDYLNVLNNINNLMQLALNETDGRLSYWTENIDKFYKIRMMDVFRKLKADTFATKCKDIETKFDELAKRHIGWEFYISRSFHNGKATLSFELLKYIDEKYKGEIGVQIEDNQFRLFLGLAEGSSKKVDDIFNVGIDVGWFDSSFNKKSNRKVFGYISSMSKNPCSYSGRWVYQYFDTWTKSGQNLQNYETLKQILDDYLSKAISLLDILDTKLF